MNSRGALRLTGWAVVGLGLLWAPTAHAFSGGIATTSFPVPALGCTFCHNGGSAPTVTLECVDCGGGPPAVEPLSVHEFKLTVFEIALQTHAGLNVSSELGTFATGGIFAGGTQTISGTGGRLEITHTAPKAAVAGMTEFSFLWTAPAIAGPATLAAWGNAVNANGSTSGDNASMTALVVSVGGDTPTPTATPPPTNTPTPTNTPGPPCPPSVDAGCLGGFGKAILSIKESVPGKEKLVAKLLKGPALTQTDLGNPLDAGQGGTGTAVSLCIYDDAAALVASALVDRAGDLCGTQPCWRPIGKAPNDPAGPGSGYRYKDTSLAAGGVLKILYKGGASGKSKAILVGKGANLPDGIPAALQTATQATMQLRGSDGVCLSATLTDIATQSATVFKGK